MSYQPKPGDQLELFPEYAQVQLPNMASDDWYVKCLSLAEKRDLLRYAEDKGISCGAFSRVDSDLFLMNNSESTLDREVFLLSFHKAEQSAQSVSVTQFKQMCDAYAAKNNAK